MLQILKSLAIPATRCVPRRHAHRQNTKPSYDVGRTVFQSLTGRDLVSFESYTRSDIFSLLWIASEVKSLQIQSDWVGKRVAAIWANPITKASLAHSCQLIKSSLCCIHEDQLKTSKNYEMLGRSLGLTADVIFLDTPSWNQAIVEEFAVGCTCPVIVINSSDLSPGLAYIELLTLFEKYGFLRRLIVSWIGPSTHPMLNTYFTLLPSIGAHFRFFLDSNANNQTVFEKGYELAIRFNTEMKELDNINDALYRSHIVSTCFTESPHVLIKRKDVKEMDLEWSLLQNDSFQGSTLSKELINAKGHSLANDCIKNQARVFQALVIAHTTDYAPKMQPPRFEGVD